MMISFFLVSFLIAFFTLLSRFGCGCLRLEVSVHSVSLFYSFNKGANGMMIFVWCPTFVFVFFIYSFSVASIFAESLKCAFSFTSLKKFCMSLSSMFLLSTFSVCIKFYLKFFFSIFNFAIFWSLGWSFVFVLTVVWNVILIYSFWCVLH